MRRFVLPILLLATSSLAVSCGGSGGRGPYNLPTQKGSVRGTVHFSGTLLAGAQAFMAIFPPSGGSAYNFYPIPQEDIDKGFHNYELSGLDFGTYLLGVSVSFNPNPEDPNAQAPVRVLAPTTVTLTQNQPSQQFDFTIEWPSPPELTEGTISGTVTLIGEFPTGESVWIAAIDATQAGPPKGQVEVTAEDVVEGKISYTIEKLPFGSYIVSIFTYDFATHKANYFGAYDGTVTISAENPNRTGIDFDADTSELG